LDLFTTLELDYVAFFFAAAMAFAAGLIRGFSGFGATMTLAPSLSLVIPPTEAVTIALIMEIAGASQLLPRAAREANWREFAPLTIAACILAPAGSYFLVTLDPDITRRMIGGTVIIFVFIMLAGYRFRGQPSLGASLSVGGLGGILLGSTGVGGPPVILYLLSTPTPADTARANIIIHIGVTSAVLLIILWFHQVLSVVSLWRGLIFFPILLTANWAGARLFSLASEITFRHSALIFLACVGLVALLI
tara:strand:+ start:259 stop:1005 length:747 start_codon:yes stop_codon:yes gene_type:complete